MNKIIETYKLLKHDLKSPLATIKHVSENLKEMAPCDSILLKISLKRLSETIDSLICEKESGISLLKCLNCLLSDFRTLNPKTTFKLNTQSYGAKYPIKINEKLFKRAIYNLILNSVEAKSKTIEVNVIYKSDSTALVIADDGVGMDERTLKEALKGVSTKVNGSGLGLRSSKEFFEGFGASFGISSKIGVGSKITVEL